jgi:signal transduction histidine kinase
MLEVFSSDDVIKILPYVFTSGATLILLAYQTVSYYHYRDSLLRDFCVYLFSQTCYLSLAIWMLLVFKNYTESSQILLIAKESLEIMTYFFYLIYTTNAIGFDDKKHKLLRMVIKATLITMLIYLPLQLFVIYGLETSNIFIFIGIRLLIFTLAVFMFWQSFKIKNNRILTYIRSATMIYFFFGVVSFTAMFFDIHKYHMIPYHFILIGVITDLIIFSIAMSDRIKNQIVDAEQIARDKEIELQAVQYKQELIIQEQKEEYRRNIAMDLHDDIGASLSSILIYSELAQKTILSKPKATQNILNNISVLSKEISNKLSDFIWSLKIEKGITQNNLKQRLLDYQQLLFAELNISCTYEIDETILTENIHLIRNLLLIIKEAMNNIAKYSKAQNVMISLTKTPGKINLLIKDDGIGFDQDASKFGNGLSNMEKRCESIQGTCKIISILGQGTTIEIQIEHSDS